MAQIFSIEFPELQPASRLPSRQSSRQSSRRSSRVNTARDSLDGEFEWSRVRDLLSSRFAALQRDLHLLDYERNGKVHRNDLRALLARHSVRLTDAQFEKIWNRYDIHATGTIDYLAFLGSVRSQSTHDGLRASVSTGRAPASAPAPKSEESQPQLPLQRGKTIAKLEKIAENEEARTARLTHVVELQRHFREKIAANFEVLKRAFLALDRANCGFVKVEDLRNVVHSFVYQLTDEQFAQLLSANDVRVHNERVSWNVFLSRFRTARNSPELESLIALLKQHVRHDYLSLRQAFLEVDYNRDGKISRNELQLFIERFLKRRLSELQVHDLMIALDPDHTNLISYAQFLQLFELREDENALRWMSDRAREQSERIREKAASAAWQAVIELVSNRVALKLPDVMRLLEQHADANQLVLPQELKLVLEKVGEVQMSDAHFAKLVQQCWMNEQGRLNYREFLSKHLRVDLGGSTVLGVSEQITHQSEVHEQTRLIRLSETNAQLENAVANEVGLLNSDQVFDMLHDCLIRQRSKMMDAFRKFASDQTCMTKGEFRRMLDSFGILLSDDAFDNLIRSRFAKAMLQDSISFDAFCKCFEDARTDGVTQHVGHGNVKLPNMGEIDCADVHELELKLREKLRLNFVDLMTAFKQLGTSERDGVSRRTLRRALHKFCIYTTEADFERLCARLALTSDSSRITYTQFLAYFEQRPTRSALWNSDRKVERARSTKKLSAPEVYKIVRDKAHSQYKDLVQAFIGMDKRRCGFVTRDEFREILEKEFHLPMTAAEFDRLWEHYDPDCAGHLDYQKLMHNVGLADRFGTGDFGTSQRIISENSDALETMQETAKARLESMEESQRQAVRAWPTKRIIQFLGNSLTNSFGDPYATLKHYDKQRKGYLTMAEVKRIMHDAFLYVTDRQLIEVLKEIGVPEVVASTVGDPSEIRVYPKSFVNIFTSELQPDRQRVAVREQHLSTVVSVPNDQPTTRSTAAEVEDRLKNVATMQYETLFKAFQAFDKNVTRAIRVDYFRRVLDCFCFDTFDNYNYKPSARPVRLTDAVFNLLIDSKWARFVSDVAQPDSAEMLRTVRYVDFLDHYGSAGKTDVALPRLPPTFRGGSVVQAQSALVHAPPARKRSEDNTKPVLDRPRMLPLPEVEESEEPIETTLRKKLHLVWRRVLAQCRVYDSARTGNVPIDIFRRILEFAGCNLRDEDLQKLLNQYDVVAADEQSFSYRVFLEKLLLSQSKHNVAHDEQLLEVLLRIRGRVLQHLTELKRELGSYDTPKTGSIPILQFRAILQKRGIEFNDEELFHLTSHFDESMSGKVDYPRFLQSFTKSD